MYKNKFLSKYNCIVFGILINYITVLCNIISLALRTLIAIYVCKQPFNYPLGLFKFVGCLMTANGLS